MWQHPECGRRHLISYSVLPYSLLEAATKWSGSWPVFSNNGNAPGVVERKNGFLRRELQNAYLFYSLSDIRIMAEDWRLDYNTERPHKELGYLSPLKYAEQRSRAE